MKKLLLGALAMAAVVAVPAASFAATYAYVNQNGEVQTMDATDANTALMTAPNIGVHSGVMLIDTTATGNPVAGQTVGGV